MTRFCVVFCMVFLISDIGVKIDKIGKEGEMKI